MLVVFDLDDTLADTAQRRHHIIPAGATYANYSAARDAAADKGGFTPDWDAFFDARYADIPIWRAVELFHGLVRSGFDCEIWTAGREDSRDLTVRFLDDKCGIGARHLTRMRAIGDYRKTVDLKEAWIKEHKTNIDILFDDHVGVVRMARTHGIFACAVGDHDY